MMKTLICINTCNRPDQIKAYAYDFIKYCQDIDACDFVVSLDGNNEETIEFCERYKIPLIYSEKREGVGISKNRILEKFNDYDYYFFLEDDVELLNESIFAKHVDIANKCGFYHMSLDERCRFFGNIDSDECGGEKINFYNYGSASFNFFTREGIEKVGGFHEEFAKWKRFGHTEHTYRFVNQGLHKRAFISIEDCFEDYCVWHNPPSVTNSSNFEVTENRLARVEQNIIDKKMTYFSIKTFSKYYHNRFNVDDVDIKCLKDIAKLSKKIFLMERCKIQHDEEIKEVNKLLRDEEGQLWQKEKRLKNLSDSKSLQLGDLFYRSIKKPYKLITYPYNFIKILLEK